jgi:hypothetical protein
MAFINRNVCKNFSSLINSNNYVQLSAQECSEVVVMLFSSSILSVDYVDILDSNSSTAFRVPANKEFTFRGLTDCSQLSAKGSTSTTLYYRTQFYGSMTDL